MTGQSSCYRIAMYDPKISMDRHFGCYINEYPVKSMVNYINKNDLTVEQVGKLGTKRLQSAALGLKPKKSLKKCLK
jgi:hypothetical protein